MKYMNLIYLRQTVDFLQRYGLKSVMNKVPEYLMTTRGYQTWRRSSAPSDEDLKRQRSLSHELSPRPRFSILVPTYNTDPEQLRQMAESVFAQTYDNWELCIADGSPKPSMVESFFLTYAREHSLEVTGSASDTGTGTREDAADATGSRAAAGTDDYEGSQECAADTKMPVFTFASGNSRVWFAAIDNMGIAGNTNAAMALASGDYIVLLDHDDLLSPDALYELAAAAGREPDADVFYSDEDMVSADGAFLHNPNFKPDFSPDLLRSCNYITHLYAVRRSLAVDAGGFSEDCDGSQDYDFTLKTIERARRVCHIPKVLYHWRVHSNSVAADSGNKSYAYDSAVRALQRHYERCGVQAYVTKDPQPGFYLTDYVITGSPLVSVLMYNCAESLREDIFFSEAHHNRTEQYEAHYTLEFPDSIADARGEYILVLRHVQSITSDAVRLLLSNCMREDVGIAVPRILNLNGKVAESGLIYNAKGDIISPFAGKDPVYPGYHCYAVCQHQTSVTGPFCFMTSMKNLCRNWPGSEGSKNIHEKMTAFCFNTRLDEKLITVIPRACATLTKTGSRDAAARRKVFTLQKQAEHRQKDAAARAGTSETYIEAHPSDPYYTPNFSQTRPYMF